MLIALKILAFIVLVAFGFGLGSQNEFAERIATEVFVYASVFTAAAALTLF